ncbi:glycosyltransferase family 21 protein [Neolentinus lepideus HHB14362 ss-1]|uniref:Ceramide glucosyltransferase n=1 Tax=Neolentinus lepideus HHB14362 ss-1 TaxID=1314782 RepID=A0A165W611_9AGAM|nr:glycosyltransferase family 21 protein [Neolentinus lepideus HHB14362 ss-1]
MPSNALTDSSTEKHTAYLVLSIVGIAWYLILWSLGLLGCRSARRRYRLRPRSPLATVSPSSAPGVSILRPLKGLDTNLYENLESTFTQEYPNYEIILSVADENDQALSVVWDLIAKYPHKDAKVVIGEEVVGVNPKVNNLIRPYRQAANDILWVLDSNVTVAPGTLARSVDVLIGPPSSSPVSPPSRRIALVHHVPFAFATEPALGARLEEAFLNTNHAKMYIAINTVAIDSCVVGKSNLYHRSDIERVNGSLKPIAPTISTEDVASEDRGLAAFGRFLAEDNMIASALWHELGLRHDLSCDVARNAIGKMSFADYIWRRVRWIRVRKHMVLAATLVEPFTESVVVGLIAATCLNYLLHIPRWLFLIIHCGAWLMVDLDVYESLAGHPVPESSRLAFVAAWFMREGLALPIWMLGMLGSEVDWRGRKYRVLQNGEVERADDRQEHSGWIRWFGGPSQDGHYQRLDTVGNAQ